MSKVACNSQLLYYSAGLTDNRAYTWLLSGNNSDFCLMELPSGVLSRLTSDAGNELDPVWSPDSRRIAFVKEEGGKAAIYQMVIGSGKATLVYPETTTSSGQSAAVGEGFSAR